MNEYLNALSEPTVVVSITATIALIFMQPVLDRLRIIFISIIIRSPRLLRNINASIREKHKKKIKRLRWSRDELIFRISKTNTYFLLFIGSIAFYIALIALGPLREINTWPDTLQLLLTSPLYIFEVLWLLQMAFVRELIDSREKIRVTSCSS